MVFNHDDSQVDYLGYKELFFMDNGEKYEIKSDDKLIVRDYSKMYSTVGEKLFSVKGSIGDIVTNYIKDETEKSFAKMPNPGIKIKLYIPELNELQRVRVSPHTQSFTFLYSIPIKCYQHVWILELL